MIMFVVALRVDINLCGGGGVCDRSSCCRW